MFRFFKKFFLALFFGYGGAYFTLRDILAECFCFLQNNPGSFQEKWMRNEI